MFRKSRIRIVIAIMASLVLFLALTLGVIYFFSRWSAGVKNAEMLSRYVEEKSEGSPQGPGGEPGDRPGLSFDGGAPEGEPGDGPGLSFDGGQPPSGEPGDKPDGENGRGPDRDGKGREDIFNLSTFYSVTFDKDGAVASVETGNGSTVSEDELISAARKALSSGKKTGRAGRLTYEVAEGADGTLVAFIDSTVSDDSLTTLLKFELIFGGAGIVLIFVLSLLLSKRIIKPLEENDKRQKQFVSDAGHELKTPVSVISANAEILTRGGDNEWLSNIRYETERMDHLIKDLLRLSRAENAEKSTERIDLSRLVTGEALPFETVAFEKGITIEADVGDGVCVQGDPGQLKQLTAILLDNAIRHGTGDTVSLSLSVDHRSAVLTVENEGEEIPKEVRDRLFERFYRRDEARAESDHFGLGLAIAKAIADAHRGSISVGCRDGKVIFTVALPLIHDKK